MTFIEKFDEIKEKVLKKGKVKFTEDFAIQVNLTDEDCAGAFYVAYLNGEFAIEPYDYHDHTAMVTLDSKTLSDILSGKAKIAKKYEEGKILVDKNLGSALQLEKLIVKPAAKKTTKKAEPKKAEVKKTRTCKTKKAEPKEEKAAEIQTSAEKPAAKKTTKTAKTKKA